jgi:hypothetical protein
MSILSKNKGRGYFGPKGLTVERRTGPVVAQGYAPASVRRRLRASAVN